ncbi:HIRAN domain-containing protein [Loigolactobacillus zhaoyuanensis]|uniref:HIRAN domain-containing protein n=1 Tax=Loigolactobacillus zhaoyuanensis TaxID=2486017 RepID=A0ABW8U8D3_9LACO|nr:HIRAN domain-containing protein [Loigolactobacillus zhaoyuanensis]
MAKDKPFRPKYEPSRHLLDFHIAGFTYHDGLDVIDELTLGKPVTLIAESDNPVDGEAVAIYYHKHKLGYVPAAKNEFISKLLYFGYGDFLEARIQYMNKETHPERQFRVVVQLKDNRK